MANACRQAPVLSKLVTMREELRSLWTRTSVSAEQLVADLQGLVSQGRTKRHRRSAGVRAAAARRHARLTENPFQDQLQQWHAVQLPSDFHKYFSWRQRRLVRRALRRHVVPPGGALADVVARGRQAQRASMPLQPVQRQIVVDIAGRYVTSKPLPQQLGGDR